MLTHTLSLFIHMHHTSYVITNHTHAHSYAIAIHSQVYWSWLRKNHWTLISFGSIPTELNSLTVIVFESHWFIPTLIFMLVYYHSYAIAIHSQIYVGEDLSLVIYLVGQSSAIFIRSLIRYRYSFTHIWEPIVKQHSWISYAAPLRFATQLAIHSFYQQRGNKLKLVAYDCTQMQGWSMNK